VWFTTNGMCVKNNTIIYVARASNKKRDCDVEVLPILTCEQLNVTTSVREERLRAWSLLLLAATVRSFAHIPLGISDRNIANDDGGSVLFALVFILSSWAALITINGNSCYFIVNFFRPSGTSELLLYRWYAALFVMLNGIRLCCVG